ncbi:hypothetical protein Pcinc_025790 [Petrolisthes cinctipes]|uniref:Uncharacterized protein n=1 Tax=Petrolisthes cinctipes TaxID=88211 RepID=A0AAE1F935_PETCI|nr:hypothetical protein Pcinc_025790 [Petrolisthes cinctipes]
MGLSSPWYKKVNRARFNKKMIVSLLVLSLSVSQVAVFVHKSLSPKMTGWYLLEFTLNATVTYLLVAALPHLVRIASKVPASDKYRRM